MRHEALIAFLLGGLLFSGCAKGVEDDNSLGDLGGQAYQGLLIDADLGPFIRITDDSATLRITFSRESEELAAQVRLSDGLDYVHEGAWNTFDGPETEELQGLRIRDKKLSGYIELEGTTLTFDGTFNQQRTTLTADVDFIGSMTLTPWEAPPGDDDDSSQD
jgi:hypothetical protein